MNVKVTARKRDAPLKVHPRKVGSMKNSGGEIQSISSGSSTEEIEKFFGWDDDLGGREALNAATYYACMQIRCNAFAKLPIKIKRFEGRGSITIRDSRRRFLVYGL